MVIHIRNTTVITPRAQTLVVLRDHGLTLDAGRVRELAPEQGPPPDADEVIDGAGHIVVPGLINTHHHLYQALTRCLPDAQRVRLFDWLLALYERWRAVDFAAVKLAAQVSIAELLRHGCTTTSDHYYMLPRGSDARMEAVIEAADSLGIRLHLGRGSMTLGQSAGGLPPDDCVEEDDAVLADYARVLDQYHDPAPLALRRIDLAPCSPFNVSTELFKQTRGLARERGVLLHTHLGETFEEDAYCVERFGVRPLQYLADMDWLGPDVYLAHCVQLNDEEIALLAATNTGVSHNPLSNLRLGSGIMPLEKMLAAGVRVGLGVDGSSSNDGGNLLAAARMALYSARVQPAAAAQALRANGQDAPAPDAPLLAAQAAFLLATRGGAQCLQRDELGHLAPGAAADLAMFRTDDIALAGAIVQDPIAALVLCDAPRADRVFVNGREVVRDGHITSIDERALAAALNECVNKRFAW